VSINKLKNMQNSNWLKNVGVVVLVVVVSLVTVKMSGPSVANTIGSSVYTKVVASNVIRACYVVYPPASIKDPNTGKLSGVFVETLEKAAENMGMKVDWNAEVGWGEMIEALNSNKCDIIGSPAWSNSTRGKSAEFSQSVYYSAINAYVRASDNRFNTDLTVANNASYKLATVDGETSQVIASRQFPNAKTLQLPQSTDVSQMLLNVVDGKADMAFLEPTVANSYIKNNPGKVKNVSVIKPVVIYSNVMLIKKGEFTFKSTIDNALIELLNNGYVESVINKYEKEYPGGFYRVAPAYVVSQ
jgi:polar amino acid transport system substrate-binding protein